MVVKSLTARTSLWFTLQAAVVFLVMGIVIMVSVDHHFRDQDRSELNGKLELIQHALLKASLTSDRALTQQQLAGALIGHHHLSVQVRGPDNQVFFTTGKASIPEFVMKSAEPVSHNGLKQFQTWEMGAETYRGFSSRLPSAQPGHDWFVAIATDTRHHRDFLAAFENELILIGICGLALMTWLGWLVTHRGFRPVLDMAHVAEGISAQQLDERFLTQQIPAELQPLARAFNSMLDRLGDSLQRLSAFSSDLAHELRTPINNLMTQTQVSLSRPREPDKYREVLYSNLEEFERLSRMIADMLFLAKADNGLMMPDRQSVDVRAEIAALFEFYEALAADKPVTLALDGAGRVVGDALMLRRAFSNLLSNAIRHADVGSTVHVRLTTAANYQVITVSNAGDTVPPEHLSRLFDRFYRADASRQRQEEGAGLGLAITSSIIATHGGEVSVTSTGRQTCFRVSLPLLDVVSPG